MSVVASRSAGARLRRSAAALVAALCMLLLSGCAGYSARVTIVPSHQAYDVDLIMADNAVGEASEIGQNCDAMAKSQISAKKSEHDNNTYCEITISIPLDGRQSFVKHQKGRWVFQMTAKSLLAWLSELDPGFGQRYPQGLKQEEFDDFHLRVDFPGHVVAHSTGSEVEGNSVIWNDAKLMFSDEGMHAESSDDSSWLVIASVAAGIGLLTALASLLLWILGRRRGSSATRSWPPRHVTEWWQRNTAEWMHRRQRDPRDPGGPR